MAAEEPRVVADADAAEFVREQGGTVYVWASDAGIKHVSTVKPDGTDFVRRFAGDGFELFQSSTIADPTKFWHVVLRHFPHRHVDALWDNWQPGPAPGHRG